MQIEFIDHTNQLQKKHKQLLMDILELARKKLELDVGVEMSITFVHNEEIQTINAQYRNKDYPTDVISFAIQEHHDDDDFPTIDYGELEGQYFISQELGDIFISLDKAEEQAIAYGHSFERELAFLTVHGFLHLNGYDHQSKNEEIKMFSLQEEILNAFGLGRFN